MSSRSRGWCFTINNYTFLDLEGLLDLHFAYMVIGFEEGENKTKHIQGYIFFHNAITFESCKKKIPRSHLEKAKGTPEQAAIYCMKDGEFYEFGEMPCKGRAKFERIQYIMQHPKEDFHLYNQYRRSYNEYINNKQKKYKERELFFIPYEKRFTTNIESLFMDPDIETYTNEEAIMIQPYSSFNVENWISGFPPRIRRGFEIIRVDPDVVYIMYSDKKELNYLKKKYVSIDYKCILEGTPGADGHQYDDLGNLIEPLELDDIEEGDSLIVDQNK